MVSQVCKRCKAETITNYVDNYCSECGSQEFSLTAETPKELRLKLFNGKRKISYKGKVR